jgi:hypothetical protein
LFDRMNDAAVGRWVWCKRHTVDLSEQPED